MYFTFKLNVDYRPKDNLSKEMNDFLNHLTAGNPISKELIRLFIYLIITKNNSYQKGLYLWGAAGSGKSVFETILQAIAGKYVKSITLEDLKDKHSKIDLVNSSVVLIPDLMNASKKDVSELKKVISGDLISARELFKNKINFRPKCLVIITSNMLWQPNDPTNGLARRILYLTINKMPKKIINNLLTYDNQVLTGVLANSISGLVNWAMEIHGKENLFDKYSSSEINSMISPNLNDEINPLMDWIKNYLSYTPENVYVMVGNKKSHPDFSLFVNYLNFCTDNGYTPLSIMDFSNFLLQQLNLIYPDTLFLKRRTAFGMEINNITIKIK